MLRWERKRKIKIQTARKRARKTALCKTFARIFKYIRDSPGIKLNGVFLNACALRRIKHKTNTAFFAVFFQHRRAAENDFAFKDFSGNAYNLNSKPDF